MKLLSVPNPTPNTDKLYLIRTKSYLYWCGGGFTRDREKATRFQNKEREFVRLSPGERWEPYEEQESKPE